MIRSLRARHRVLVVGVGVVAGSLGVAGLLARRTVPSIELPAALAGPQPVAEGAGAPAPLRFDSPRVRGAISALAGGGASVTLELEDGGTRDDLLAVYWSPPGRFEALSADAIWLGSVVPDRPSRFSLPRVAGAGSGSVVLFDLRRGRVVAAADTGSAGARP
jgi:hypothetical protein